VVWKNVYETTSVYVDWHVPWHVKT